MNTNKKYILLQSFCCGSYLVIFSHYTYYLSSFGLSNTLIGTLSSVFSLIAIVATYLLGRVADKSRLFNWRTLSLIMSSCIVVFMGILLLYSSPWAAGFLFSSLFLLISCCQPLVNAAGFYYSERGENINFGIARGLGSFAYAVFSVIMGRMTLLKGPGFVPVAGIIFGMGMLIVLVCLPSCSKYNTYLKQRKNEVYVKISIFGLIKKYPAFFFMVAANFLLMTYHNMYNTYLINIINKIGGNSNDLGLALSIAAMFEIPTMFFSYKLIKKIPAHILLAISPIGFIVRGLIFAAASNVLHIYGGQMLSFLGYAVFNCIGAYFTNECMDDSDKVTGQSMMSVAIAASTIFSGYLGGYLIDNRGIVQMLLWGALIGVFGGISALMGSVIYNRKIKVMSRNSV